MIGWIGNALTLYGSYCVGNYHAYGFLMQIAGNACWVYIGCKRYEGRDRYSLIALSSCFVLLYIVNFLKWVL